MTFLLALPALLMLTYGFLRDGLRWIGGKHWLYKPDRTSLLIALGSLGYLIVIVAV